MQVRSGGHVVVIPESSPSSRVQNVTSLASNASGENARHVSGNPGYTEPSAFLSFLQGWSYISVLLLIPANNIVAQTVKNVPAIQETWVQSLGQEDPLEKEMATHCSTLT